MDKLYVDCWTSGNPGIGGYRVTDHVGSVYKEWNSGQDKHSNNYFELAAIGAGVVIAEETLSEFYERDVPHPGVEIFSDSITAISWATKGPKKAIMEPETIKRMYEKIDRLRKNFPGKIKISKWDTAKNGQIPADYGRK